MHSDSQRGHRAAALDLCLKPAQAKLQLVFLCLLLSFKRVCFFLVQITMQCSTAQQVICPLSLEPPQLLPKGIHTLTGWTDDRVDILFVFKLSFTCSFTFHQQTNPLGLYHIVDRQGHHYSPPALANLVHSHPQILFASIDFLRSHRNLNVLQSLVLLF